MKFKLLAAVAAAAFSAAPAFAGIVALDFEGPTSFASIDQYYNGGTDGAGVAGPTNLFVSFGGDALGLKNDELGPYFSNAPSPVGVMGPVGPAGSMDVAGGFDSVAFSYSASDNTSVRVWSGLGGTGTLLGTIDLAANAQAGCSDSPFCHWDSASLSLNGVVAKSVSFGDASLVAAFDNVTINQVPEPSSVALMALGLVAVAGLVRRKQQAA